MSDYLITVGIECHVQLKTKTKLFSAVGNDARQAKPNTLISHICLGMPGALPVLNKEAVNLAIRAAYALNTEPQKFSAFDRKHYFYPDLPKGYQISQLYHPVIKGGYVEIEVQGQAKKIGITRAHLEEDAGKNTHPDNKDYSLIDLNRAGTPLLEIVSEPDIHSSAEAKAFARELYLLMRYADVSDADLYYGNMRFDVNISVSKDHKKLGNRSEIKNLNSFKAVEKSIDYEADRQIKLLESGKSVTQETRGWDDAKQRTFSQRSKEEAHDYRYFPDPDLPPIELEDSLVSSIKSKIQFLPKDIRARLLGLGMDVSAVETIIDQLPAARLIYACLESGVQDEHIKRISLWLAGEVQFLVSNNELSYENITLDQKNLVYLSQMVEEDKISSTGAKAVLTEMLKNGGDPDQVAKKLDLIQVSDEGELAGVIEGVVKDNPKAVQDFQSGEAKAIGFLVGQVMKLTGGKANPSMVQKILREKLK